MAKKRPKVKRFSIQGFDNKHFRLTEQYVKAVNALFDKATDEFAKNAANAKYKPNNKLFSFDDYPQTKALAEKIITNLANNITTVVETGSRKQWLFACQKNDEFINSIFDTTKLTKAQLKKMQDRNLDALQTFQQRKIGGMDLSQRVWKYVGQYKEQIELGLDVGIGEGKSAAQLSRDLRQNLRDPNRLFRRVRDKHGNLVLSKAAKAFHPGVGVYRSSAKNAMRLTRTEINMAYRESDWLRWQQLDFVLGFEVRRSNREPLCKCAICEKLVGKYPKQFKFKGWHPQCMCHAVPILEDYFAKERSDDRVNRLKAALNGTEHKKYVSKNIVTDVPQGFKDWVDEHIAKQPNWRSTPYFIRDNFNNGNLADGLKYVKPDEPVKQIRIKTEEQKADIQKRWNTRLATNRYGESIDFAVAEFADIPSLQKYLAKVQKAIADGVSLESVDAMMSKFDHKVKVKEAWDERVENNRLGVLLDNVAAYKAQFGLSAMKTVYNAVESKLASWQHLPLEKQLEKLKFEIDWVAKNKKYDTWQVAQDAYKKRFAEIKLLIFEKEVDAIIDNAKLLKPKANSKLAILLQNKEVTQDYVDKVTKEMDALVARRNKAVKGDFAPIPDKEIKQLLDVFENESVDTADKRLRGLAASVWKTLTLEERNVLTKYTGTYSYLNEPLRGIPYYGSLTPNADHVRDLPILTKALSKFKMPQNTVVRRGVDSWTIKELGYGLDQLKPGDVFVDKGFLSTAVHREKGFIDNFTFIIVVPKGAQGFYAEPFSHYTDNNKFKHHTDPKKAFLWDGITKEYIGSEQEWIGQRGSQFKVIKKVGKTIYLQLIGQLK